jgi:hypothetical protein
VLLLNWGRRENGRRYLFACILQEWGRRENGRRYLFACILQELDAFRRLEKFTNIRMESCSPVSISQTPNLPTCEVSDNFDTVVLDSAFRKLGKWLMQKMEI